eukprot:TRINITY_DN6326_c0_g1_i1.p2 TRINITY_DN6326_c0_g1~~TRINITY_DN6326_c0_g1_i1.p2  ORF type:complete len:70 (+),score=4.34 TRINITY_DN6326_c0_g1_i1:306-515(+)
MQTYAPIKGERLSQSRQCMDGWIVRRNFSKVNNIEVDLVDTRQRTPLMKAALGRYPRIVRALLASNAKS